MIQAIEDMKEMIKKYEIDDPEYGQSQVRMILYGMLSFKQQLDNIVSSLAEMDKITGERKEYQEALTAVFNSSNVEFSKVVEELEKMGIFLEEDEDDNEA